MKSICKFPVFFQWTVSAIVGCFLFLSVNVLWASDTRPLDPQPLVEDAVTTAQAADEQKKDASAQSESHFFDASAGQLPYEKKAKDSKLAETVETESEKIKTEVVQEIPKDITTKQQTENTAAAGAETEKPEDKPAAAAGTQPVRIGEITTDSKTETKSVTIEPVSTKTSPPEKASGESREIKVKLGNVRDDASLKAKINAQLQKGDAVMILERKNKWFHVQLESGETGWIHSSILTEPGDISVRSDSPAEEPAKEVVSAGDAPKEAVSAEEAPKEAVSAGEAPKEAVSAGEAPKETASAEEVPKETASAEEAPKETASAEEAPQETASAGEAPKETVSAGEAPKETVSAGEAPKETVSTPKKIIKEKRPKTKKKFRRKTVTVGNGNIRQKPSLRANVITQMKKGDVVSVTGKKGDWYQVVLDDGKTGWAHKVILTPRKKAPKRLRLMDGIRIDAVSSTEEKISFFFNGKEPPKTYFIPGDPVRLVCDFMHTRLGKGIKKNHSVNDSLIHQVRTGLHGEGKKDARVVFDLKAGHKYRMEHNLVKGKVYVLTIIADDVN